MSNGDGLCIITARRYNFVSVTRRSNRAESWYPVPSTREGWITFTVQGGCDVVFSVFVLRSFSAGGPGTNFCEHYACRDTSLIEAAKLSPVKKLVADTGAVSRYKLSRSHKAVKVQEFNCVQMRALTAVASAKAGVRVQEPLQICLKGRS